MDTERHGLGFTAVDLFAGLGGFTTGAQRAGVNVIWAANHNPAAVEWHAANHPGVQHSCQDLHQADWSDVPRHDLLLASPCCQGHSRARGTDRPHHDRQRSTAWAVVSCAEYHLPACIIVENVPEFADWLLFPAWEDALLRLGYSMARFIIDAADHGVPQHRRRLFLVLTRSQHPIRLKLPQRDHVTIDSVIDWSYPRWNRIRRPGRSRATLRRIRSGRASFGSRFVAPFYGSGSGTTGRSIHRPIGTITTLDRWAVIDGHKMRMLQPPELRAAMGFPESCALPATRRAAIQLLGNAVCPPVAADLITAIHEQS